MEMWSAQSNTPQIRKFPTWKHTRKYVQTGLPLLHFTALKRQLNYLLHCALLLDSKLLVHDWAVSVPQHDGLSQLGCHSQWRFCGRDMAHVCPKVSIELDTKQNVPDRSNISSWQHFQSNPMMPCVNSYSLDRWRSAPLLKFVYFCLFLVKLQQACPRTIHMLCLCQVTVEHERQNLGFQRKVSMSFNVQ